MNTAFIGFWYNLTQYLLRHIYIHLKGKAILKENIIKMKDILFRNILVQVS